MSGCGRVGLLGKAPCQADFLRLSAPAGVVHAFHRWLEDGISALPQPLRRFPAEPLCFAFTAPGERTALFGVMGPSEDAVGRKFPLCVFCQPDAAGAAGWFASAPLALAGFFASARALVEAAASLDAQALAARLAELAVPSDAQLAEAEAALRARLGELKVSSLKSALDGAPDGLHHAARIFLAACARERREPAKANVILDCPLAQDAGPAPWLELAKRALGWKSAPPSLLWAGARMLLSIGPPPPSAIGFWANPASRGTKLWPLVQADASLLAASKSALPAPQREALDDADLPLETLFARLTA